MDILFGVLRSGCPVSRSPLRRKDEQRIRRVAGEQLQRLEASKRASMQSEPVHTDMVHLELVEVFGDVRHRRANQAGSVYPRGCRQLELRRRSET